MVAAQESNDGPQAGERLLGLPPQLGGGGLGSVGVAVHEPLDGGGLDDDPGDVVGGDVVQFPGEPTALLDEGHLQLPPVLALQELLA